LAQANCSAGKKAVGCHISPNVVPFVYDMWRKTFPSANGSSCTCSDFGGAGTDVIKLLAAVIYERFKKVECLLLASLSSLV
jgi:hypothetical protein